MHTYMATREYFSNFFTLLLSSIFLALSLSTSGVQMVTAHRKIHQSVEFQLPLFPIIVPDVYNVSWNFNIKGWPYNQTFKAGDILVFNYDQDMHNVVPVDEANYLNCSIPETASVYTSGEDPIVLRPGFNYFICGTMGHCLAGMLINVTAT